MESDLEVLARALGRKMGPLRQEGPQELHLDTSGLKCLLSVFPLKTLWIQPGSGAPSRLTELLGYLHASLTTALPVTVADLSPSGC